MEIIALITSGVTLATGIFFISSVIFNWSQVELFNTPEETFELKLMLSALGIIGLLCFTIGLKSLITLIG